MEKNSEIKALPVTLLSGFLVGGSEILQYLELDSNMMERKGKRQNHAP